MSKLPHLLPVTPMPSVLFRLEILPFALHSRIGFHLRHGFRPLETILVGTVNEVVKDKRIGSFLAVFGQYSDEKQVDRVSLMPFQDTQ